MPKKMKVLRGKRIRVTRLDECGTPIDYDSCGQVVSSGFVEVSLSAEIEEGETFTQPNADGALVISEQGEHNFVRWGGSVELVEVDPELVSLMTRTVVEYDAEGDPVGFRSVEGQIKQYFALELWSGISDKSCPDKNFGYFLLPFVVAGTLGDFTIANDVTNFTVENFFTRTGGEWGVGPYNVVADAQGDPAPLEIPIGPDEPHLQRLTTVPPPDVTAGCQPIPA